MVREEEEKEHTSLYFAFLLPFRDRHRSDPTRRQRAKELVS